MDNSAKTDEQVSHHVLWELTHAYRTQGLAHSCLYLAFQTALVSILSPGSSPELTVPLRVWQEHHLSLVPAHHFGGYSCPHSHGPGQQISSAGDLPAGTAPPVHLLAWGSGVAQLQARPQQPCLSPPGQWRYAGSPWCRWGTSWGTWGWTWTHKVWGLKET